MDTRSSVIKFHDGGVAQATPFNFEDMAERARAYLEGVRKQAVQILAEAKMEAATIRQQAEAEGRKTGTEHAERVIRSELEKHLVTLLPALREAVSQIKQARQAFLAEWEKNLLQLAGAIAVKLVRQAVIETPQVALPLIRETLELAAKAPQVRIRLHPEDEKALRPVVMQILRELSMAAVGEVVPDPAITRGGCRVETEFGSIDQQFETQVQRIVEELTGQ
ncbi:MAG: FliH/SctL family protein [Thermogutta sp.]